VCVRVCVCVRVSVSACVCVCVFAHLQTHDYHHYPYDHTSMWEGEAMGVLHTLNSFRGLYLGQSDHFLATFTIGLYQSIWTRQMIK